MRGPLSFDAYEPDGTPRECVGMWRPPSYPELAGIVLGERGTYYSVNQVAEAWRRGEFDRPLYAERSTKGASTASGDGA